MIQAFTNLINNALDDGDGKLLVEQPQRGFRSDLDVGHELGKAHSEVGATILVPGHRQGLRLGLYIDEQIVLAGRSRHRTVRRRHDDDHANLELSQRMLS